MDAVAFLQSYSEIAIAVVGFSGIVIALRSKERTEDRQDISMTMLIGFGSISIAFGFVPQILLGAELSEILVWRIMSAAVVCSQLLGGVKRYRQTSAVDTNITGVAGPIFIPLMMVSMVAAVSNLYFGVFWIFSINLLIFLLAGIGIFTYILKDNAGDA